MKRREFITLLGGAAAAWPLAARGQQPAMPLIGVLGAGSQDAFADLLAAFRQSLKESGYVDGQTVAIEYRFAEGQFERLPRFAADLVQRRASVMVSTGTGSSLAAKAASSTVPLVFLSQGDPVKEGLVASFNRPRGNATGMALLTGLLVAKRLEFARQLVPGGAPIGYLQNPLAPEAAAYLTEVETAARGIGQPIITVNASNEADIDAAFEALSQQRAGALVVATDGYLFSRRNQIVALSARRRIPAIYDHREYAAAGGLISYGAHLPDAFRQIGIYVARILKGETPADLPVIQPTRFELIINLKTAKALGRDVPDRLLALADEVVE